MPNAEKMVDRSIAFFFFCRGTIYFMAQNAFHFVHTPFCYQAKEQIWFDILLHRPKFELTLFFLVLRIEVWKYYNDT